MAKSLLMKMNLYYITVSYISVNIAVDRSFCGTQIFTKNKIIRLLPRTARPMLNDFHQLHYMYINLIVKQ